MSLEALESLLAHPGWRLFEEQIGKDWGPKAYAQRLKAAVSHARSVGTDASHAIELVDAANDAIGEAMQWPAQQVSRLRRVEEAEAHPPTQSRRGGL